MHDALRVDEHLDVFSPDVEQPAGLDHLQPFVHQGGGVDGDFFAHFPVGVGQGLLRGDCPELALGQIAKRPAGGSEDELADIRFFPGLQRLGNGAVFAVNGQQGYLAAFYRGHDQVAGHDQGFLVGQGDVFSGLDGRQGGSESGPAHNGGNNRVRARQGGNGNIACSAGVYFFRPAGGKALGKFAGCFGIANRDLFRVEGLDLLAQETAIGAGGQPDNAKAPWELTNHLQNITADRTRRAKKRNIFHWSFYLLRLPR